MSLTSFDMPSGLDAPPQTGWGGKENEVYARFFRSQRLDPIASREAGKPIAKGVDMVEIRQYGEKDSFKDMVTDAHKARFPRAWQAYQAGVQAVENGTPLAALFPANPEVVETLNAFHIYTVQALANLPDSVSNIPFAHDYKRRANQFLDGAEKGKGFHQLEKRAEDAELQVLELKDSLEALQAQVAALSKKGKSTPDTDKE